MKTVTLRVDRETYQTLRQQATAEKRSLANFIEVAALQYIRWSEFADDEEMAGLRSNTALMRRLKVGSRQAKRREGRFVA